MPTVKAKSDAEWEAESDAQSLASAEKIKSDPPRMKRATRAATRLARERQAEAKAMTRVSRKSPARGKRK